MLAEEKARFSEYRLKHITESAESMEQVEGNQVTVIPEATVDELIAFANIATERVSGRLVLLAGEEGSFKYVISSNTADLRAEAKDINKSLLGRGGGKPNMIQGSFLTTLAEIEKYFS